ncbi:hypothetical protein XENOCAPTIV_029695, partial [Xenoophorus captivus]
EYERAVIFRLGRITNRKARGPESPSALQLRYLQTLNTIAAEKNSTIIFPLPMDVISNFMRK